MYCCMQEVQVEYQMDCEAKPLLIKKKKKKVRRHQRLKTLIQEVSKHCARSEKQ